MTDTRSSGRKLVNGGTAKSRTARQPQGSSQVERLRAFIEGRKAETLKQIDALKEHLGQLDRELSELDLITEDHPSTVPTESSTASVKEAIVQTLVDADRGLTSHEIVQFLRMKHGIVLDRKDISPPLSRLRAEGVVLLAHGKWLHKSAAPPPSAMIGTAEGPAK